MNIDTVINELQGISTTHICDTFPSVRLMQRTIQPIAGAKKLLVGFAYTIASEGDLIPVLRGLQNAPPGSVLIIDGATCEKALSGEMIATAASQKGLAGIVIDGYCRDQNGLVHLDLPFYACGVVANVTTKEKLGQLEIPVNCGGVVIHPGDLIIGDENGIIVLSLTEYAQIIEEVKQLYQYETTAISQLQQDTNIADIINLDEICNKLQQGQKCAMQWTVDKNKC